MRHPFSLPSDSRDPLTRLATRAAFYARVEELFERVPADGSSLALLLFNLNRFKDINDTLGHTAGDQLLAELGRRLAATFEDCEEHAETPAPEVVLISRQGSDEFGLLLANADAAAAEKAGRHLLRAIEIPFDLCSQTVAIDARLGIALAPQHAGDAATLLRQADIALSHAKEVGTDLCLFTADQDQHNPERLILLTELRTALERGELVLHYQPKVDLHTGRLVGAEALVRWQHPTRGLTPPGVFLPIAEQTGLIEPLNRWVLDAALQQQRAWRNNGLEVPVAVNLSRRTLQNLRLASTIAELLAKHNVPATALELEITETTLDSNPVRAVETLTSLHELGVRLSIDDFGTGFSSLASLKALPVDELKIDQTLVRDMASDASTRSIVRAIIDMADDMGLHAVAEGIEDRATWDLLARLGCTVGQGYHISPPLAATDLLEWNAQHALQPLDRSDTRSIQSERVHRRKDRLSAETEFLARKAAEAELREKEERFRRQYKGIPVPTYTWQQVEDDFILEDYNDAAESITRGGVNQWLGSRATERYADLPEILAALRTCVKERRTVQNHMRYKYRSTGRERHLALSYVFVPPCTVMLHTEDVTERVEAEQQRDALARSEKLRALGQMASGVAHDLNQILMLIASHGELARRALDQDTLNIDEAREMCVVATQAALDGGETVKRLLRFARSGLESNAQAIDLAQLAEEVVQLTAPRWRSRDDGQPIVVWVEMQDAKPPVILGSAAAVREALTNLIFNAVDAMPAGGSIRLVVGERDGSAMVEVVDTGVGIPPEVQARLFEPFFTTKGERGTGLGLATVFGVVEGLGGRIEVDSTPGSGTTFRILLPLAPSAATPTPAVARPVANRSADRAQLRILAVDDEPGITRAVARLLRPSGHVVRTAASGEQALEELEAEAFDVVISDLAMGPGLNGWELAEQVQQRWPRMRFVLATGWGASIDAAEAQAKGVSGVLAKPYRLEDLEQVLAA